MSNNKYPINMSTIYRNKDLTIWLTITDDAMLYLCDSDYEYKAHLDAMALVQHFFPNLSDAEKNEIISLLGITGKKKEEFNKVQDYFFQKLDENAKEERRREELSTLLEEFYFPKDPDQEIRNRAQSIRYNIDALKNLDINQLQSVRFLCYDIFDTGIIAKRNSLQITIDELKAIADKSPELHATIDRLENEKGKLIARNNALQDSFVELSNKNKPQITTKRAAEIIGKCFSKGVHCAGFKNYPLYGRLDENGKTIGLRSIQQWQNGTVKSPSWYPGLAINEIDFERHIGVEVEKIRIAAANKGNFAHRTKYIEGKTQPIK